MRFDVSGADFGDMAVSGNAEVLYELGLMYATGRNGETDMIAAHKWLNIAAFRGCSAARTQRDEIAGQMSKDEIRQAQREARYWVTRH